MAIDTMEFGRTGHRSSRVIFGAAALAPSFHAFQRAEHRKDAKVAFP
jgi:hypothetical protein